MLLYSNSMQVHYMGGSQAPQQVVFCCKDDVWHNLSCPSTQGTNHGLPSCSTLCCTCEEFCVTGGRHICKNFVTPVRKISDQQIFIVYFSTPLPFFSTFLHLCFFPSLFFCVVVLKLTSVSMFCTLIMIAVQLLKRMLIRYISKFLQITFYVILATVYPIVYTIVTVIMNDGKHCIHK